MFSLKFSGQLITMKFICHREPISRSVASETVKFDKTKQNVAINRFTTLSPAVKMGTTGN